MATTESPLQKRIRERSEELRSVLEANRKQLSSVTKGLAAFAEAGIVEESVDRITTAMNQAIDTLIKAAAPIETPKIPPK